MAAGFTENPGSDLVRVTAALGGALLTAESRPLAEEAAAAAPAEEAVAPGVRRPRVGVWLRLGPALTLPTGLGDVARDADADTDAEPGNEPGPLLTASGGDKGVLAAIAAAVAGAGFSADAGACTAAGASLGPAAGVAAAAALASPASSAFCKA